MVCVDVYNTIRQCPQNKSRQNTEEGSKTVVDLQNNKFNYHTTEIFLGKWAINKPVRKFSL